MTPERPHELLAYASALLLSEPSSLTESELFGLYLLLSRLAGG